MAKEVPGERRRIMGLKNEKSPAEDIRTLERLIRQFYSVETKHPLELLEEISQWAFMGYSSRIHVEDIGWLTKWAVENINAQPGARTVEVVAKVIDKLRGDLWEAEATIQHLGGDMPGESPERALSSSRIDGSPPGGPGTPPEIQVSQTAGFQSGEAEEPEEEEATLWSCRHADLDRAVKVGSGPGAPPCVFCGDKPLGQKFYRYPPEKPVPDGGPSKFDDAWELESVTPVPCPICGIKRPRIEELRRRAREDLQSFKDHIQAVHLAREFLKKIDTDPALTLKWALTWAQITDKAILAALQNDPHPPGDPPDLFCWQAHHDAEGCHGPFKTPEDAITDAREHKADPGHQDQEHVGQTILIGHAILPDPGEYIFDDLEWILDGMDNNAHDNGFWNETGTIFEPDNDKIAQESFKKTMKAWARKYLKATTFTMDSPEEVRLEEKGKADG